MCHANQIVGFSNQRSLKNKLMNQLDFKSIFFFYFLNISMDFLTVHDMAILNEHPFLWSLLGLGPIYG